MDHEEFIRRANQGELFTADEALQTLNWSLWAQNAARLARAAYQPPSPDLLAAWARVAELEAEGGRLKATIDATPPGSPMPDDPPGVTIRWPEGRGPLKLSGRVTQITYHADGTTKILMEHP